MTTNAQAALLAAATLTASATANGRRFSTPEVTQIADQFKAYLDDRDRRSVLGQPLPTERAF